MNHEVNTKSLIVTGILTLLVGILFIIFPDKIINLLGYITGIILMIAGVFNLVLYFVKNNREGYSFGFSIGLILFFFGLYLTLNTGFIMDAITVIFGFYILINGILGLQFTMDAYRAKVNTWKYTIGMALVNLVLGAIILYNPFKTTELLVRYIGVFMSITAVLSMLTVLINRSQHQGPKA